MSRRALRAETFWLAVPGAAQAVQLYDLSAEGCVIYDGHRKTASIAVAVGSRSFFIEDAEIRNQRVAGFAELLNALCQRRGIAEVQILDRTVVRSPQVILESVTGARARSEYEPRDRFVRSEYERTIREAANSAIHEQFVRITLDLGQLAGQVKAYGGKIQGVIRLAEAEIASLRASLTEADITFGHVVGVEELAGMLRVAFNPDDLPSLRLDGAIPVASPESAGPMWARESMRKLETDRWFHRGLLVTEWPRREAAAGFLRNLIFAGEGTEGFAHSVSLIARPRDAAKALKRIDGLRRDKESGIRMKAKMKIAPSSQELEVFQDLQRKERDLLDGFGEMDFYGVVTVSATDDAGLAMAQTEVERAAASSGCEVRAATFQHYAAFLEGATVLGVAG